MSNAPITHRLYIKMGSNSIKTTPIELIITLRIIPMSPERKPPNSLALISIRKMEK
jgi:hypothetical protein